MITIKQVAEYAGVSASCVSKYLKDENSVRDYNKKKIAEAIQTLNYIPSQTARSLRRGKSMMVKAVMPSIVLPFFAEMFEHLRIYFADAGYTLILHTITPKAAFTANDFMDVDGAVIAFPDDADVVFQLSEILRLMDKPLIVLAGQQFKNNVSIFVDIEEGMASAARLLKNNGRRHIAFVGGVNSISSNKRFKGYSKVVSPDMQCGIYRQDFSIDWGYEAAENMLKSNRIPDAVLCENDSLAAGVIKFMMTHGISVPDDVWVIGFDNVPIAEMYNPSISSVSLPSKEMSKAAAKLFTSAMSGEEMKSLRFESRITLRGSTGI